MTLYLDTLQGLPEFYLEKLRQFDNVFLENRFLENFEDNKDVQELINEINNFCLGCTIIAYHYTRAIESDFVEKGMLIRTGKEIRNEFMKRHFHLFTLSEQKSIIKAWNSRFGESDSEYRDLKIYFNFTLDAFNNSSAELLLKYYGGEQIYAPLYELHGVEEKLSKLGSPVILCCKINPNNVHTYLQNPWGKIIMSSYHRAKNSEAHTIDQDGYQKVPISSKDIEIIKLKKTFCQNEL